VLAVGPACNKQPARAEHLPGTIFGTVRDPFGAPASGVTMSLCFVGGRATDTRTDARGRYEFRWEEDEAGCIPICLVARDFKRGLAAIHLVDAETTCLGLAMQEGLTLSTRVRDSSGLALSNATATVVLWVPNNLNDSRLSLTPNLNFGWALRL
jgi:hypothetical protein